MTRWKRIWQGIRNFLWPPRAKTILLLKRVTRPSPLRQIVPPIHGLAARPIRRRQINRNGQIKRRFALSKGASVDGVHRIINRCKERRKTLQRVKDDLRREKIALWRATTKIHEDGGRDSLTFKYSRESVSDLGQELMEREQKFVQSSQQYDLKLANLCAEEHELLEIVNHEASDGRMSAVTVDSLRDVLTLRARQHNHELFHRRLGKTLETTKLIARRALRAAGLGHFEGQVRQLLSEIDEEANEILSTKSQLKAKSEAFYTSAAVDAERAGASPELPTRLNTRTVDDHMAAATTDQDKKHIYNGTIYKLDQAWVEHQAFRSVFEEALRNRVDEVRGETGSIDDDMRDNVETEFTIGWLQNWSSHIKVLNRIEDAFIDRRDHILELGVLDRVEAGDPSVDAGGTGIREINPDEEGRDIPAFAGERPEDGRADSMGASEIAAMEDRLTRLKPKIANWINDINDQVEVDLSNGHHDGSYSDIEKLDLCPWDSVSLSTRLPRHRKKLADYQEQLNNGNDPS